MARLQILELPEGDGDDRPPFVLVVDQYEPRRYVVGPGLEPQEERPFDGIAEQIGARGILVFQETVDIPANDLHALPPDAHYEMTIGGQPVRWDRADDTQAQLIEQARTEASAPEAPDA